MIMRKIIGENKITSVTVINNRLYSYGKSNMFILNLILITQKFEINRLNFLQQYYDQINVTKNTIDKFKILEGETSNSRKQSRGS